MSCSTWTASAEDAGYIRQIGWLSRDSIEKIIAVDCLTTTGKGQSDSRAPHQAETRSILDTLLHLLHPGSCDLGPIGYDLGAIRRGLGCADRK